MSFHDSVETWVGENLVAAGPFGVNNLQTALDHLPQLVREVSWQRLVQALGHLLSKSGHVGSPERRQQSGHLVQNATDGPNVALEVVRLVLPDLGTSVVRSASLSGQQTVLGLFRNVQVTDFHATILCQK